MPCRVELPRGCSDLTMCFPCQGWGKGGQKVNKTTNAVILTHEPTGEQVKVHATRSLQQNRKIARKQLALKVDAATNGSDSVLSQQHAKAVKQKRKKALRAAKKYKGGGDEDSDAPPKPKLSAKEKRALRQQKKAGRSNR